MGFDVSGLPGQNKQTAEYASEDANRRTHSDTSEVKKLSKEDSNRKDEGRPLTPNAAGKDSNRAASMTPRSPMNEKKALYKAIFDKHKAHCVSKGMSEEDAEKEAKSYAGDEPGDDADDAKKALDDIAKTIQDGTFKFTQEDLDQAVANATDRFDEVIKGFNAAVDKLRERVGLSEKAFLALHAQSDLVIKSLAGLDELKKSLDGKFDELSKSLAAAPAKTEDKPDEVKKSLSGEDNKPVEEPKAAAVPSPLDEKKDDEVKKSLTNWDIRIKANELLASDTLDHVQRLAVSDALTKSLSGVPTAQILNQHGKVLGLQG